MDKETKSAVTAFRQGTVRGQNIMPELPNAVPLARSAQSVPGEISLHQYAKLEPGLAATFLSSHILDNFFYLTSYFLSE